MLPRLGTAPVLLVLTALCSAPAWGQSGGSTGQADKSGYTLFNPTPRRLRRPMAGDRPDVTESPITVDAGRVQLETGFVAYSEDDDLDGGGEVERWAVFDETNVRIGLLNATELQVITTPYAEEEVTTAGGEERLEGFGDVTLRLKQNLWGNDIGDTAFAVMPFVKIPTGTELSNDHVEGGVFTTLGWDVAENWGLGFQAQADAVFDEEDDDYDTELGHTAVIGFDIAGPVGGYAEYVGVAKTDGDYEAAFSGGATYQVNEDLVLDAGAIVGLNEAAEDLTAFTGMTIRF